MTQLRLLVVVILTCLWFTTLIDTAAVRSEEFSERLQRMALDAGSENFRTQRATQTKGEQTANRTCYNTPCGWAVYVPFTRRIEYFMKNTCKCPDKSYKCVRMDDDLSVSAYVYRCRQNTTADDIEPPEDQY